MHLFDRERLRDRRSQGIVRRDQHPRPQPGHHPWHRRSRRRTRPPHHHIASAMRRFLAMKFNRFLRLVSITALLSLLAIASGCIVKETSFFFNDTATTESK